MVNDNPEQDFCSGAPQRPLIGTDSPGTTIGKTVDVVGDYTTCGDVTLDTPGIWWWVNGTGEVVRASSCSEKTHIKVKLAVFSGPDCDNLQCVGGTVRPDYECPYLSPGVDGEWGTLATAIDFKTELGVHYYVLAMEETAGASGDVWLSFRVPSYPLNDHCVNSMGPIPRNDMRIVSTTADASIDENIPGGICDALSLYPGVWFQIIGTGSEITVGACGEFNRDGHYFSVYHGANCEEKTCVTQGTYTPWLENPDKCSFGAAKELSPLTEYTFDTVDRDRYYIMVHYAHTAVDKPTGKFRFYVDDGSSGFAGTGGVSIVVGDDAPSGNNDNNGSSNNDGNTDDDDTGSGAATMSKLLHFPGMSSNGKNNKMTSTKISSTYYIPNNNNSFLSLLFTTGLGLLIGTAAYTYYH